jgi:hypothetical protein
MSDAGREKPEISQFPAAKKRVAAKANPDECKIGLFVRKVREWNRRVRVKLDEGRVEGPLP